MFNKNLKKELEQLREENKKLKGEVKRLSKCENEAFHWKLNYDLKEAEAKFWCYSIQEYLADKRGYEPRQVNEIIYYIGDRVQEKVENYKTQKFEQLEREERRF